jgi:hypothetical protein
VRGPVRAMPEVRAYPKCSACGAPYILRYVFIVLPEPGAEWLWQRDCKHKKAPAVGVVAEPARAERQAGPPKENP